jgi:hypothetical protein
VEVALKNQAKVSRREFCVTTGLVPIAGLIPGQLAESANPEAGVDPPDSSLPWYRTTFLWGQTNLSEEDPRHYDVPWWRRYWRKTGVQGIIVNAGGIVAYYPTAHKLHRRARFLGERDLFGEILQAARSEGLVVMARMDCNRAHEDFFQSEPDWFCRHRDRQPIRASDLYLTCIHSPYYDQYIPQLLREISGRYRPEGFADNSWSGLDRDTICFCSNCTRKFRQVSGRELPTAKDWRNPVYRSWIRWNYARRLEIWDLYNQVVREAGGEHSLWIGMVSGSPEYEGRRFRDLKGICERANLLLIDHQGRNPGEGFENNADTGKRLHGLLGWEKLMPESMATYQRNPTFRKASASPAEARSWMLAGIAGGIQTWWHHVGAFQEDHRQFDIPSEIVKWCNDNRNYLVNRTPVANVAIGWSQTNSDFYGTDQAEERVVLPYRGLTRAMIRARIPYLPLHLDQIDEQSAGLSLLILPAIGSISEEQAVSIRKFIERGGSLIASGETSLFDESGERRSDFALSDVFGVHLSAEAQDLPSRPQTDHSYLRLLPDSAGEGSEAGPRQSALRHPVLQGFAATNIVPFGGRLLRVKPAEGTTVLTTYVPDFPIYPPETSWMRQPRTDLPGLVVRATKAGGRVAYLAADIDRCYGLHGLPDHEQLLMNLVRWAAGSNLPLEVQGAGTIDCHLYRQEKRLILHLVNLTAASTWGGPVRELTPIGPIRVSLKLDRTLRRKNKAQLLVKGRTASLVRREEWAHIDVPVLLDHEVLVIE